MSDPFRPINKGEAYLGRLRNTETLNGMLEAARRSRELGGPRTGGGSGRGTVGPYTTVWIRAHKDLPRGSVVKVAGVIAWGPATSDADEAEAACRPGFLAGDPAGGEPFLITLDPAQGPVDDTPGDIVRAAVSGLALVRLSTPGGVVHGSADVIGGDSDKLLSSSVGPAAVLWSEAAPADEDERWASVLIGSGDAARPRWAEVTGAVSGGLYPARLATPTATGWTLGGIVRLRTPNGEPLTSGLRYLSTPAGFMSAGIDVYVAVPTCCGPDDPPPAACFCDGPFCVPVSGCVNGGDPSLDGLIDALNRDWTLTDFYADASGTCVWYASVVYDADLGQIATVTLSISATGEAYVSLGVQTNVVGDQVVRVYPLASPPFVCAGPNTFNDGGGGWGGSAPATLSVTSGECVSSSGPPCDPGAEFCATLAGGAGAWAGTDGSYTLTGDGTVFSGGSPPTLAIAIYVADDGTALLDVAVPGAAYSPVIDFTCEAGGSDSGGQPGGDIPSVTITAGACP